MTPPLFSIISITHNNLKGLQTTSKSVKSQIFNDFQWFVVDGASQDGTRDWLKKQNILHISEPDNGLYDAMNKGIEAANGTYLIFLNAGDQLADHTTLKHLTDLIQTHNGPDFIYGDSYEGPAYKRARPHQNIHYGMFTHHQAMVYKRGNLGTLRYNTDYKIAADYDFTLRFLSAAENVIYTPAPLCLFEPGGLSQTKATQGRREQFIIRKNLNYPLHKNILVYIIQNTVWTLRRIFPRLYWFLKQKT